MIDIEEMVAEVLRLDAQATPGPWHWQTGDDDLHMCATYVGTTPCLDARTMAHGRDAREVVAITLLQHPRLANVRDELWDENAALIAYYRTAAPALAREVQRLQAEIERLRPRPSFCVQCLYDLAGSDCCPECGAEVQDSSDGYQDAYRAGQEAMRERCLQALDTVDAGGRP